MNLRTCVLGNLLHKPVISGNSSGPRGVGMHVLAKPMLQAPYRDRKEIKNTLQTNAMRLDDEWCRFFKDNGFFIGVSLDGPQDIHDRYRKDRHGAGTFDRVMAGIGLLQKHGVEFNALACVGRETAYRPLDVYRFFKQAGINYIQFTPIVERMPDDRTREQGLWLASPAALDRAEPNTEVTPWTVEPEQYGEFLVAIYEEWVRQDVGEVFVMNFEWALNAWLGNESPVCIFSRRCGRAVALEHNGNVLTACWGGCPKHRFATSPHGEPGMHYLCAGYKKFFRHIRKYQQAMATLLENDLPASMVMEAVKGPLVIRRASPQPVTASQEKL